MEVYSIRITKNAKKDLDKIYKSGNKQDILKVEKIFEELQTDPMVGIGNPEKLKYDFNKYWSRRINKKDRLVYSINDLEISVMIVSALGHYDDK